MKLFLKIKSSFFGKIVAILLLFIVAVFFLVYLYLGNFHRFSRVYQLCNNKLQNGMSRDEVISVMLPLVKDSFMSSGFSANENSDLFIMDKKGIYCEVKIVNGEVVGSRWGNDAP